MPRVEKKVDISAPQEKIFKIIDEDRDYARWNIVVNEVTELGPGNYFFKTNVGDVTSTRIETNPPESLSATQEGSPMTSLGYVLKPKGDVVEATIWAEFDDPGQEPILGIAGEMLINSLKKYAEFLEAGGNPDEYNKKKK
ncbi:MAG: SRPBCC family protein [Candidatus Lokiarchaeota archaeon]|nr:SRPBCC family protein [Candidatus Lokiarchaeota archaeon]